jgi:hypothetical protein
MKRSNNVMSPTVVVRSGPGVVMIETEGRTICPTGNQASGGIGATGWSKTWFAAPAPFRLSGSRSLKTLI